MSVNRGVFYVIATPIGNLSDITERAREVLQSLDHLYAEDTRHTLNLCRHLGVSPRIHSLHEHNEEARIDAILEWASSGLRVGLVSDAGTPLISDPGYRVVAACHQHGVSVSPVPGVSALTAALSVCGLPTDRFAYEGFLPSKPATRRRALEALASEGRTLVFFESRHRILASLADLCWAFGEERMACIARELTKTFETVSRASLGQLLSETTANPDSQRGEFVIVVTGCDKAPVSEFTQTHEKLLLSLAVELPPKKAAALVAAHLDLPKRVVYERLLLLRADPQA